MLKYVPLIGIGLAVWGLVSLNWPKIVVGAMLFFAGFAFDTFKKRNVLKDAAAFAVYKPLNELIRTIRPLLVVGGMEPETPKGLLAQALFYMGMIDAASQSAALSDRQFLDVYTAIFTDQGFGEALRTRVLAFHQAGQIAHPAFAAIKAGGSLYLDVINGGDSSFLAAGPRLSQIVEQPSFPGSLEGL